MRFNMTVVDTGFLRWLHETDTVILACWDMGHVWSIDLYDHIEKRPHGAHMLHGTCLRGCGTQRSRYLTASWVPDSGRNAYKYPHGYSPRDFMQGEPFAMSAAHRAQVRRELARRAGEETAQTVVPAQARFRPQSAG